MKHLVFLSIFFFTAHPCFSQSLEGDWKGNYRAYSHKSKIVSDEVPIDLKFILNDHNTYNVISITKARDIDGSSFKIVCKAFAELIGSDSIYLEEKEVLEIPDRKSNCLQKMFLKIIRKKNVTLLTGMWENVPNESKYCDSAFGKIVFKRRILNIK